MSLEESLENTRLEVGGHPTTDKEIEEMFVLLGLLTNENQVLIAIDQSDTSITYRSQQLY